MTGSGSIVIAAGLGLSVDFYRSNMASFERAGFRVYCPDVRHAGARWGVSVDQQAEHLVEFCRANALRDCFWIGHSIGCQTAMRVAAEHPELARAVVLAGPTGGTRQGLLSQATALGFMAITEPWRLKRAVVHDYVRLSPFNYLGTWIKARKDDFITHARAVRCPVRVLVGTRDRVPSRDVLRELVSLENVTMEEIPGGQHGLPIDAQQMFDRAVLEFFLGIRK